MQTANGRQQFHNWVKNVIGLNVGQSTCAVNMYNCKFIHSSLNRQNHSMASANWFTCLFSICCLCSAKLMKTAIHRNPTFVVLLYWQFNCAGKRVLKILTSWWEGSNIHHSLTCGTTQSLHCCSFNRRYLQQVNHRQGKSCFGRSKSAPCN